MRLLKSSAIAMTLVLVLQTGCDLWCQHAQETVYAQLQGGAVPTCHGGGESEKDTKHQPANHGTSKDCLHPQAADDNSKLQSKIVKATHPVAVIQFSFPVQFETRDFLSEIIARNDIKP